MNVRELVDYAASLDCVHCGLCLNTCPTYRLTGQEPSSPRGRIHLMRAVAEGSLAPDADFRAEMDFCLLCRHCESVCPSGVRFGEMMEHARDALARADPPPLPARFARWVGFRVVLPHRFVLRTAAALARVAQGSGALGWLARTGDARAAALRSAPHVPPSGERALLPQVTPCTGPRRATALVLQGCVMPELFGRVNRATVAVLARIGVESIAPRAHVCCGSLHAHNGDLDGARELARATIAAFEEADGGHSDAPIVVNSAGCGAHMKDYGRLLAHDDAWRARAQAFAARVRDVTEFLAAPEHVAALRAQLTTVAENAEPTRVAWDDPCHLCHGQKIRREPRALIDAVPGLARVELEDSEQCCGSAGVYALLRPTDSAAVLAPKLATLRASGADVLVTANPGCQLQWETGVRSAGLDVRVVHVVELLDEALTSADAARSRS